MHSIAQSTWNWVRNHFSSLNFNALTVIFANSALCEGSTQISFITLVSCLGLIKGEWGLCSNSSKVKWDKYIIKCAK